jgi:HlyD family secretion protein
VPLVAALLALALVSTGCSKGGSSGGGGRASASAAPAPPVPTAAAHSTTVAPVLSISGIIAPLQNVAITSALSEPTNAVPVNEGDSVRRGQTLAVLDTTDLRANLDAQERTADSLDAKVTQTRYQADLSYGQSPDQVTSARAALAQAQQTLTQAQADLARDNQLLGSGYVSAQATQQQQTVVNTDASAVRSAQANLSSALTNQRVNGTPQQGLQAANVTSARADASAARAQAEQIQAQIAKAVIVSPVDGVIVNRNLNPGEYPGSRTLFVVQETDNVYAELNASSADVFRLRAGSGATLVIPGDSRTYGGKVVAVLGQVQPGSTNFTVKVRVANPGGTLVAGMPVTGTLALPKTSGVGIPAAAFLDDSRTTVLTDDDGVARLVHVRELASDGTTSIVTGLPTGTSVVANGQLGLTNGQKLSAR